MTNRLRTLVLITTACSATLQLHAQDPGRTHVALDVLVANSEEISVVKVASFELNENGGDLTDIKLHVVRQLKLPMQLAENSKPGVDTSMIHFTTADCKTIQQQSQMRWTYDLSSSGGNGPITTFEESKATGSELLLFRNLQSGTESLQFFVDLNSSVRTSDLRTLNSKDKILARTNKLIEHYRGVERVKTIILETSNWTDTIAALSTDDQKIEPFEERALIVLFDAQFEKLLRTFLQAPAGLHDDNYTTRRVYWLNNARLFYHFHNDVNTRLLEKLRDDPEIGAEQKQMVQNILAMWRPAVGTGSP